MHKMILTVLAWICVVPPASSALAATHWRLDLGDRPLAHPAYSAGQGRSGNTVAKITDG